MISTELFRKVRRIQIRSSQLVTDIFAGLYNSAFKGRGMEFEDVREYQPGDEVRCIDWNVTARMHYPFVKNFREERQLIVNLIIDMSASSQFGSTHRTKNELIAEIAAVLALVAVRNHDKVGLIVFTDTVELYVPPKADLRHVMRVIRELLVFEPKGRGTDIAAALSFLGKVQKRRGVCFLVSDFISTPFANELRVVSRRHHFFGLCITDPREITFPNAGLLTIKDMETGECALVDTTQKEVREALQSEAEGRLTRVRHQLHQVGARFVNLSCGKDYLPLLSATLREGIRS